MAARNVRNFQPVYQNREGPGCMGIRTRDLFAGVLLLVAPIMVRAAEPARVDLSELKMLDLRGGRHALSANDVRGTAFVFLSSECPISRQYIPELNRLAK